MIAVFDIAGPLVAYSLLRSAGQSAVSALILSGAFPALGIAAGLVRHRRVDTIGVIVLAGIAVGTILGLAVRVIIVETTSTATALTVSKVMPYAVGAVLVGWMIAYGRRARRLGERLAATAPADPATTPANGDAGGSARPARRRRNRPPGSATPNEYGCRFPGCCRAR